MRVHSPIVAYPQVEPQPARVLPTSLAGKTIGILDNQKPNARALLAGVYDGLHRTQGTGKDFWAQKPPNLATTEEELERLVDSDAAVVIVASADCGSCTSWCVHDAIVLERRGKPAIVLATEHFLDLAHAEAKAYGVPDLHIVSVPHPLADVSVAEIARYAERATQGISEILGK